jgi:DUF971 family protein
MAQRNEVRMTLVQNQPKPGGPIMYGRGYVSDLLSGAEKRYAAPMRVLDLQHIGTELAIRWENGEEDFIPLEKLRRACPCAGCQGEMDILGNIYKNPDRPLAATAFELKRFVAVGGYAIQLFWADGHNSGLYAFDYLRRLAAA